VDTRPTIATASQQQLAKHILTSTKKVLNKKTKKRVATTPSPSPPPPHKKSKTTKTINRCKLKPWKCAYFTNVFKNRVWGENGKKVLQQHHDDPELVKFVEAALQKYSKKEALKKSTSEESLYAFAATLKLNVGISLESLDDNLLQILTHGYVAKHNMRGMLHALTAFPETVRTSVWSTGFWLKLFDLYFQTKYGDGFKAFIKAARSSTGNCLWGFQIINKNVWGCAEWVNHVKKKNKGMNKCLSQEILEMLKSGTKKPADKECHENIYDSYDTLSALMTLLQSKKRKRKKKKGTIFYPCTPKSSYMHIFLHA